MSDNTTTKPKNVDYFRVPRPLWCRIRRLLPKEPPKPKGGRPRADAQAILNGIWYVQWTGCQWKAVHRDWFGVCSSTLHERFQDWQRRGIFLKIMVMMLKFYARQRGIQWLWQALDSKACPAPLGGQETGPSPVDRRKRGSKIHLLVDQGGAPLSVHISGANVHDKWLADDLIISMVVPRPDPDAMEQHLCMDKGYDYPDVHQWLEVAHYIAHLKHRRRRGDLSWKTVLCPVKHSIQPTAGSSSAPSAGSASVAVSVSVGEKRRIIGWASFNSLVPMSFSIWQFMDRYLANLRSSPARIIQQPTPHDPPVSGRLIWS